MDFTVWLGNAPLDGFVVVVVVADLRLADAALAEGNAVLPDAAPAFEEFASWLTAATPGDEGEEFAGLRDKLASS